MYEGKVAEGKFPRSWKKTFDSGVLIPSKKRDCEDCDDNKLCDECDSKIRQNKVFNIISTN